MHDPYHTTERGTGNTSKQDWGMSPGIDNPYETTQRGTGYYLNHPLLPPPPPSPLWRQRRTSISLPLFIVLIALLCIAIGATIGAGAWYLSMIPRTTVGPNQATPGSTAKATPTLEADQAMDAGDFSLFMRGFAQAMAQKQYDVLKRHTDTNNFQGIVLYADGGYSTWRQVYNRLTTGTLSFTVEYPIITAKQKGYDCVGYSQQGIPGLMSIDAQAVEYVVGTASEPNTPDQQTLQTAPDGTIFVFERPNGPGDFWLWRGFTLNNVQNCNA